MPLSLRLPQFIVTSSRSTQSDPITNRPSGKSLPRIWPSPPTTAPAWTTVRAPSSVTPFSTTWERSRTPSPRVTREPTMQKGPISTPAPSRAPSSISAVGWIVIIAFHAVKNRGAEFGFGAKRVADKGLALETPHWTPPLQRLDRHPEHVAGMYGLAKAGL